MDEEYILNEIYETPGAIQDTVTQVRPAAEQLAATSARS